MPKTGALEITTPSEREVAMTRTFTARRALVFDAHTKPELVRRWLLGPPGWSMPTCEIDLRVGGKYRYVWKNDDGRTMGMGGTFREVKRPERLVTTELFDEDWTGGETLVTITFAEKDGRTIVTTMIVYSSKEARDGALKTGMADGMEAGYARLDALLAEQVG
jgi:uncharacterized protein YndB with AHSA1/START domain